MSDAYDRPDGVTDAEWNEYLSEETRITDALLKLQCPDCRSPVIKKLDPDQPGTKGAWFNYKCTFCEFVLDEHLLN